MPVTQHPDSNQRTILAVTGWFYQQDVDANAHAWIRHRTFERVGVCTGRREAGQSRTGAETTETAIATVKFNINFNVT